MQTYYVYVIGREEGPVKVGVTGNLMARLAALRTGCPFAIKILYAHPSSDRENALHHEDVFHDVHSKLRLEGEWFSLDSELAIESVQQSFQHQYWFAAKATFERLEARAKI